jgi:hypothetical protein
MRDRLSLTAALSLLASIPARGATWREAEGDFEYFRGRLDKAEYDVEEP